MEAFFKGEKQFLSVSSTLFSYELICYALSVFREICVFLKWTRCSVLRGKKKQKEKHCKHGRATVFRATSPFISISPGTAKQTQNNFLTKLPAGVAVETGGKSERTEGALNQFISLHPRQSHRRARTTSPCCEWHGQDEITPDHEG